MPTHRRPPVTAGVAVPRMRKSAPQARMATQRSRRQGVCSARERRRSRRRHQAAGSSVARRNGRHTYGDDLTPTLFGRCVGRVVPYDPINTGMLPHQFRAFTEGLFGGLHSEFDRTPKASSVRARGGAPGPDSAMGSAIGAVTPTRVDRVKIHCPYVSARRSTPSTS